MDPISSQPPAPVQAPVPAPKPASKLPWILLIVLLLVATGSGGAFLGMRLSQPPLTPTPIPVITYPTAAPSTDPTASWQTYTDSTYKYSIKYPSNWNIPGSPADMKLFIDRPVLSYLTVNGADVLIAINKKTSEFTTNKDYFDALYNQTKNIPYATVIKKFSLSGESAIMLQQSYPQNTALANTSNIEVYVYHNNNVFEIGLTGLNSIVDKDKSLFDQILSTFKFINMTPANIKTQTIKGVSGLSFKGFSISYPDEMTPEEDRTATTLKFRLMSEGQELDVDQGGMDENVCLFKDSPDFQGPADDLKNVTYTELSTTLGKVRYYSTDNLNYQTCWFSQGQYQSLSPVGRITFLLSPGGTNNIDSVIQSIKAL